MNSYQLADMLLRLVAAGANAALVVEDIRRMEERGDTPDQIYQYLSDMADELLDEGGGDG